MGQISVSDAQIYARKLCLRHGYAIGMTMAMLWPWHGPWPLEVVAQVGLDTKVRGVF